MDEIYSSSMSEERIGIMLLVAFCCSCRSIRLTLSAEFISYSIVFFSHNKSAKALFSSENFSVFETVALSFLFDKYYLIM